MYKMVDIGVKEFTDAKVHTIIIGNKKLFWVKMYNVKKKKKSIENIYHLLTKKYKRREK